MESSYIQFGCGLCAPETWLNFDVSPTLRLQRLPVIGEAFKRGRTIFPDNVKYGDITKGLPIAQDSAEAVYCSHVLEHLALNDMRKALQSTYLYLKSGGTFRFVLPDIEALVNTYVQSTDQDACSQLMLSSGLGKTTRPHGVRGLLHSAFGSYHFWMWDYKGMAAELEKVGFHQIRRAVYHDSDDIRFQDVEVETRWGNATLGVDCKKP